MSEIEKLRSEIEELTDEIDKIKKRNYRVEADKAWEISSVRKMIIAILTYFMMVVFFYFANLSNPLVNSIIPSLAFILSTMTIPIFKKIWIDLFYKK